ncbi:MAG: demethylmenaquinone methyltransferase [Chthonomonas sp.]
MLSVHAPRDPQATPWLAEGDAKRRAVQTMFAEIAGRYDLLNGVMSLNLHRRWRSVAVRTIRPPVGGTAVDVCSGTGDFLAPLRQAVGAQGTVVGLDFCRPMLEGAVGKTEVTGLTVGDACRLPLRDACADCVTVGWGIRNVPDMDAAHREIARVLRPGGKFVSLDMAVPRNPVVGVGSRLVCRRVLPALGRLFGLSKAYTYLPESTLLFATREALADSMRRAGFVDVRHRDFMLGNICMHWGTKA